jgi:hypothetical protein
MGSPAINKAKLIRSAYSDRVCCEGVSRVVHTTELQGMTRCHGKLMEKLQQVNDER